MYKQCILKKNNREQTSWLPSKFAIKDKVLKLGEEDGWTVISVGACMSDEQMKNQSKRIHKGIFSSIKDKSDAS